MRNLCRAISHDKILHLTLGPCSVWAQPICRSDLQHRKIRLCYQKVEGGWTYRLGSKGEQKNQQKGWIHVQAGAAQRGAPTLHHLAEVRRTVCSSIANNWGFRRSLDFIKGLGSGQQTRLVQSLPLISSIKVSVSERKAPEKGWITTDHWKSMSKVSQLGMWC